jgi:hypothetical protein
MAGIQVDKVLAQSMPRDGPVSPLRITYKRVLSEKQPTQNSLCIGFTQLPHEVDTATDKIVK